MVVVDVTSFNSDTVNKPIRPITCSDAKGNQGICMFSLACRQSKGKPIGICKDTIYAGSCCQLPGDEPKPFNGFNSVNINHNQNIYSTTKLPTLVTKETIITVIPSSSSTTTTIRPTVQAQNQHTTSSPSPSPSPPPKSTPSSPKPLVLTTINLTTTTQAPSSPMTTLTTRSTVNSTITTPSTIHTSTTASPSSSTTLVTTTTTTTTAAPPRTTTTPSTMLSSSSASSPPPTTTSSTLPPSTEATSQPSYSVLPPSSPTYESPSSQPPTEPPPTIPPTTSTEINTESISTIISSSTSSSFSTETVTETVTIAETQPSSSSLSPSASSPSSTPTVFTVSSANSISLSTVTSTTSTPTSSSELPVTVGKLLNKVITTQRPYNNKLDCGVSPLKSMARVVGGRNAHFGEWPWQVLIKEATWLGLWMKTKCGGVLIDHRWVLTAAHCQPGFWGSLLVVVGEYDLTGDVENLKPVQRPVKRMIVHRNYNPSTFENDIALMELESPFDVQPHVVPICLPEPGEDFVGQVGHVAGWGKLSYGGPIPSILQVVKLPILANDKCQEMFDAAGHDKEIKSTFLCAGYMDGGKDSCEGDSGGPLMVKRANGHWVLVGTVSHGIKCAEPNLPGVYMKTAAYRRWIDNIINLTNYKNNLNQLTNNNTNNSANNSVIKT